MRSEKDQDLVDTIEAHKSMAWFELDESAEFGKNDPFNIWSEIPT